MSSDSSPGSATVGVAGLLGVAFVVLKLCGVIDWSWWWVTAPFWGGAALGLVIIILMVLGGVALTLSAHAMERIQMVRALRSAEKRLKRSRESCKRLHKD